MIMNKGLFIAMCVSALLFAACAPAASAEHAPERVELTLTEYGFSSTRTTFEAGKTYEFVITNTGTIPHEMVISPPHFIDDEDSHIDHSDALIEVEESELPPQATVTVAYTFPEDSAGQKLEFGCYVPGHYEAGMKLSITVE
jgi:uncharacterized cupredoxin-like copper-binding protein